MGRRLLLGAAAAATVAVPVVGMGSAASAVSPSPIVLRVAPVSGTVYDGSTGEEVHLTGSVILLIQVDNASTASCRVRVTGAVLASGTGETSAGHYVAFGLHALPPDPCAPTVSFGLDYDLFFPPSPAIDAYPPNPCLVQLSMSPNGAVTGITSSLSPPVSTGTSAS
jgi:hypothetical protein